MSRSAEEAYLLHLREAGVDTSIFPVVNAFIPELGVTCPQVCLPGAMKSGFLKWMREEYFPGLGPRESHASGNDEPFQETVLEDGSTDPDTLCSDRAALLACCEATRWQYQETLSQDEKAGPFEGTYTAKLLAEAESGMTTVRAMIAMKHAEEYCVAAGMWKHHSPYYASMCEALRILRPEGTLGGAYSPD